MAGPGLGNDVEETLSRSDVHTAWEESYYGAGNVAFYERAFDEIVGRLGAPPGARILDAGCGQGYHSIRLAARGYRVEAVDFSPAVLQVAKEYVERAGYADAVTLRRENLRELSFPDASFRYVLCWGVLMHIPQVEEAVAELARVLQLGGVVVVSERNNRSLDTLGVRLLRRLRPVGAKSVWRPAGLETWKETAAGMLMTRQVDVAWLIREFERNGLRIEHRHAGEFTEAYVKLRNPRLARAVHALNLVWFVAIRTNRLASGNILYFRKPSSS